MHLSDVSKKAGEAELRRIEVIKSLVVSIDLWDFSPKSVSLATNVLLDMLESKDVTRLEF